MADQPVITGIEEWRDVVGWEGLYQVSSLGRVRGVFGLRKLKSVKGYRTIILTKSGRQKHLQVHGLVCEAFHGRRVDGLEVNHINNIKTDNRAENLEWMTRSQNQLYRKKFGKGSDGERNCKAVLKSSQVNTIRQRLSDGILQKDLAKQFGVSKQTISAIHRREVWNSSNIK